MISTRRLIPDSVLRNLRHLAKAFAVPLRFCRTSRAGRRCGQNEGRTAASATEPTRAGGRIRRRHLPVAAGLFALCAACNPSLPEPDSPGAKLYAERCGDPCHRLYAPGVLKFEMWKVQVQRMQGELIRRGLPPLTPEEKATVLDYLQRHSG